MVFYRYNPVVHRAALLTSVATLLLIFMGGLVTSHGAGMSVPDWPNSYGYNMWLYPPSQWWNKGGIFYEHSHRLMGTVVGMCAIVLAGLAWKMERRTWVRYLAYSVLGLVIFQGLLGGLRVIFVELKLAVIHAVVAQVFFCVTALAAMVTSKWWNAAPNLAWSEDYEEGRKLIRIAAITLGVVFAQLLIGSIMRHYQAGLAIPDLPLAYGKVLPPITAEGLTNANAHRAFNLQLDHVSLAQIWTHFGHRVGAVAVSVVTIWLSVMVYHKHRGKTALVTPASWLMALLVVQFTLGIITVLKRKPADIASAHVAVGALVLVTCFVLLVRSMRLYSRRYRAPLEPVRVEVRAIGPEQFIVS